MANDVTIKMLMEDVRIEKSTYRRWRDRTVEEGGSVHFCKVAYRAASDGVPLRSYIVSLVDCDGANDGVFLIACR